MAAFGSKNANADQVLFKNPAEQMRAPTGRDCGRAVWEGTTIRELLNGLVFELYLLLRADHVETVQMCIVYDWLLVNCKGAFSFDTLPRFARGVRRTGGVSQYRETIKFRSERYAK